MLKFIDKNSISTSFQFGFKANSSTELTITSFYGNLSNNISETCFIFLDLRKAFDSVNHSILLKKLYHYAFRGEIFNFFASNLADRQICIKIGSIVSSPQIVDHGLPRGSRGTTRFSLRSAALDTLRQ